MSNLRALALALGASGIVAGGGLIGGVAGAGAVRTCKQPSGARTVLLSKQARVWRRNGSTYICLARTGRRLHLGDGSPEDTYPSTVDAYALRLNRRYFAYALQVAREEIYTTIRLLDLRSGRFVRTVVPETEDGPLALQTAHGVTDLEVTINGSLVWITQNARSDPPRTEVAKIDRSGRTLLDSGQEIELESLALAGDRVYWMNAGVARTATLNE